MRDVVPRFLMRNKADAEEFLSAFNEQGLELQPEGIEFACGLLCDDWLSLWGNNKNILCNLKVGKNRVGVSSFHWAEVIQSIYDLRGVPGLEEQARRLCLPSHERLDTALVLLVAGRYRRRGFNISFEPNGLACSDLRLDGRRRLYVEVKRANIQEHHRLARRYACSVAILNELSGDLVPWLEDAELRLEVRFSRGFSTSIVDRVCDELSARVPKAAVEHEQSLRTVPGSDFMVFQKASEPRYRKGTFTGKISVKQAGTPIQVDARNMPIRVGFDWSVNLKAIGRLIKKASTQLAHDYERDRGTEGFIVLEADGGQELLDGITQRFFHSLPPSCLGIVVVSDPGWVIPRQDLTGEILELMRWAGLPLFAGGPATL